MNKEIVIFITGEIVNFDSNDYNYGDRILKNISSDVHEIFYSGQNQGKNDEKLLKALENNCKINIFYRLKKTTGFTFLGNTNNFDIVQYRKVNVGDNSLYDERLQLHFVVNNIVNKKIPSYYSGLYCYKKDVLKYLNYNEKVNYALGYYIINLSK